MRRAAAVTVAGALVVVLAGCGRASPEQRALEDAEGNLGRIRSGTLSLKLLASSGGAREGKGVGFEVTGPFAVAREKGKLPLADLRYTRITGDKSRTTRFVSTADAAFVELDGKAYRLAPDQVEELRARGDGDGGEGGLEGLRLDEWIDDPALAPGPAVEGVATDRISGRVDPVAALNDLLKLALQFGASADEVPATLEGKSADRVRKAVRSSRVNLVVGREDRLLRHLDLAIELAVDAEEAVRAALGDLAGVGLRFQLDVAALNRPVEVTPPADADVIPR